MEEFVEDNAIAEHTDDPTLSSDDIYEILTDIREMGKVVNKDVKKITDTHPRNKN
jgi:hypothetical protein